MGQKPENTQDQITYRRSELYEEVWKEPVRTVAKRYGVSDVALGKICRKLKVPLPGLGHWARINVGQKIPRPPLPELPIGTPTEIVHDRWRPREPAPPPEPAELPIIVPETLHNPHKLVSDASRLLRGRDARDGLVRCWGTRCLDIRVSRDSLSRALRIMNSLIRALENRRLQVEVTRALSWQEREQQRGSREEIFDNATRVCVDGEWICFGMAEKRSVVHREGPEPPKHLRGSELESWIWRNKPLRELAGNGTLELSIRNWTWPKVRALWHDGKNKRLEDCLNDFVAHLYLTAEALKKRREDDLRATLERQEAERRRLEEEERRREEAERAKRLVHQIDRWRLARDIREYVAKARDLAAAGKGSTAVALEESLKWAEAYAERIDPLVEAIVHPGSRDDGEADSNH